MQMHEGLVRLSKDGEKTSWRERLTRQENRIHHACWNYPLDSKRPWELGGNESLLGGECPLYYEPGTSDVLSPSKPVKSIAESNYMCMREARDKLSGSDAQFEPYLCAFGHHDGITPPPNEIFPEDMRDY